MKNRLPITMLVLLAVVIGAAVSIPSEREVLKSEADVKKLIETSYINGAFNDLNPDAMEQGFHEDFAIFSANGEKISKYPIAQWVEGVRKRKDSSEFDPASNQWDHNFVSVDVTGNSAAVKLELHKDDKHVYTDYLSLLKFDSGWKIVAKVYHQHR